MHVGVVFLVSVLAVVGGAQGARASETFSDPQGDATGGAPDITQAVLSNDFDGNVTFALTIDRTTFSADDQLFVFLDTDKNASTGVGGLDYAIVVTSEGATLVRASGTSFAPAPHPTLTFADGGKTLTINRSDLGGTTGFSFVVKSRLRSTSTAGDSAPDSGSATYDLELKPVLGTLAASFSPAKPRAGHAFRLARTTLRLQDRTAVRADSVSCVAKLGGKSLAGHCSWHIPKNAKGKRLAVTLTARYKGASATFTPWRFRVG